MKTLLSIFVGLLLAATTVTAAPVFTDTFNSYPSGSLIGQGPWLITGTSTVNPIQVSNGKVLLTTTGQDANAGFTAPLTLLDGTSLYMGVTLNLSAAQATGDYFLHVSPGPAGNSFDFFQRLFAKSSGTGFVLGYAETSGGAVPAYGSDVLNFNTDYRVVLAYNLVPGPANDTAAIYVNPSNLQVAGNNTAYVTKSWTATTAETNLVGTVNLRQGTAGNAPTLSLDDLVVSQTFADVSAVQVPEPNGLFLIGGIVFLARGILRRKS